MRSGVTNIYQPLKRNSPSTPEISSDVPSVTFSDGTHADIAAATLWEKSGVTAVGHHNWQLTVPAAARVACPVLPHNPYSTDGHAEATEGRLVVSLPLGAKEQRHSLTLSVAKQS